MGQRPERKAAAFHSNVALLALKVVSVDAKLAFVSTDFTLIGSHLDVVRLTRTSGHLDSLAIAPPPVAPFLGVWSLTLHNLVVEECE